VATVMRLRSDSSRMSITGTLGNPAPKAAQLPPASKLQRSPASVPAVAVDGAD
jgi:hypothetical protein